jgi:hypothetical protein
MFDYFFLLKDDPSITEWEKDRDRLKGMIDQILCGRYRVHMVSESVGSGYYYGFNLSCAGQKRLLDQLERMNQESSWLATRLRKAIKLKTRVVLGPRAELLMVSLCSTLYRLSLSPSFDTEGLKPNKNKKESLTDHFFLPKDDFSNSEWEKDQGRLKGMIDRIAQGRFKLSLHFESTSLGYNYGFFLACKGQKELISHLIEKGCGSSAFAIELWDAIAFNTPLIMGARAESFLARVYELTLRENLQLRQHLSKRDRTR